VKFYDSAAVEPIKQQIAELLRERHWLKSDGPDDFTISNPAGVLAARAGSARTFGILLASIASVSLMVGGISIMNVMLVSATERTREIALRMAVGARRRDIRRQFLIEATALTLIGGVIASALGSASAVVVAFYSAWPVLISPWVVMLACGFSILAGSSAGTQLTVPPGSIRWSRCVTNEWASVQTMSRDRVGAGTRGGSITISCVRTR
jgi:putative ABC transport system permease protein